MFAAYRRLVLRTARHLPPTPLVVLPGRRLTVITGVLTAPRKAAKRAKRGRLTVETTDTFTRRGGG
jgi:hypothetical protein